MNLANHYRIPGSETVCALESQLQASLLELREELQDHQLLQSERTRTTSSVPLPRNLAYYRIERKRVIERTLQVSSAQNLVNIADVLKEDMNNAEKFEYTSDSLALLIHQHFTDRIYQLVQSKHYHLLRWKRFCQCTKDIENCYPHYKKRMKNIMHEYYDCVMRAQRLSVAKQALGKPKKAMMLLHVDDLLIYTRWLIFYLHSTKKFHQYLQLIQWLPFLHSDKFIKVDEDDNVSEEEDTLTQNLRTLGCRYEEGKLKENSESDHIDDTFIKNLINPSNETSKTKFLSSFSLPHSLLPRVYGFLNGGRASNDLNLGVPIHSLKLEDFKENLMLLLDIYQIPHAQNATAIDEIKVYSEVHRKFKNHFNTQEMSKNLKTYDSWEALQEKCGSDTNTFVKKPANWLPFVKLIPRRDIDQEKKWTELRQKKQIDLLLLHQSHLLKLSDFEKVLTTLKKHVSIARGDNVTGTVASSNYKQFQKTENLWKKIYSSPEVYMYNSPGVRTELSDDKDDNMPSKKSKIPEFQHLSSYDYLSAMRMLGLDETDLDEGFCPQQNSGYTAFLFLRHLRIRDLQMSCLYILNYMRSIQRTLTINDGGLSLQNGELQSNCVQNHRNLTGDGRIGGGGGGLGNHGYFHDTPADFKISETDFIEYADIENHDDFYFIENDRIYVKDQKGFNIIYDAAINDYKKLEEDLLLLGSFYIENDKIIRNDIDMNNHKNAEYDKFIPENFDIPRYSLMHIDRFGVLLDLWTQEAAFQNCKSNLIRCYFEAYCNVFDRDEKRLLAQTITDIMFQRPRYMFQKCDYFIKIYHAECINLQLQLDLVQAILNQLIEDDREYIQKSCRESQYGLPPPIIEKTLISIHTNIPSLQPLYLLEFHPFLAMASQIPVALRYILQELRCKFKPKDSQELLSMEKMMLELALSEWNSNQKFRLLYSVWDQENVFFDSYIEDPLMMCDLMYKLISTSEQMGKTHTERQISNVNKLKQMLELVHLRSRLLHSCWESTVLAKLYTKQAAALGLDEHHLYMRNIYFDQTGFNENVTKPPPGYLHNVIEESVVDKYVPPSLNLAISNYDESELCNFSFSSNDSISKLLTYEGLKKIQLALKCQICHQNALIASVLQVTESNNLFTIQAKNKYDKERNQSLIKPDDSKDSCESVSISITPQRTIFPEAFVSIQFVKTAFRDMMLQKYNNKVESESRIHVSAQSGKIKHNLLSEMCDNMATNMSQYLLRSQIIGFYNSIFQKLEEFPTIRDAFFTISRSEVSNSKSKAKMEKQLSDMEIEIETEEIVMSEDGKVINIWYIPHCIEVLTMFSKLPDEGCINSLNLLLQITSALHDILLYLIGNYRLGNKKTLLFAPQFSDTSAAWGGLEGIKTELKEIIIQIHSLSSPTDPVLVAELLIARRDVAYLEFDVAVRYAMVETFLLSGNKAAYEAVNTHQGLTSLANTQHTSVYSTYLKVPEPLEAYDSVAQLHYPWRSFLGRNGPYPKMLPHWYHIDQSMQLCLASLKDLDKLIANGELLGVSLHMEEVVLSEFPGFRKLVLGSDSVREVNVTRSLYRNILAKNETESCSEETKSLAVPIAGFPLLDPETQGAESQDSASTVKVKIEPTQIYLVLRSYLILWKQLEVIKMLWASNVLCISSENPVNDYQEFCNVYRRKILFPVLQSLDQKKNQGGLYAGFSNVKDPMITPALVSDFDVKGNQLLKLLESFECHMIKISLKEVNKKLSLAIAERARDEILLPTDLWKRSVTKSFYQTHAPNIMCSFRTMLLSNVQSVTPVAILFSTTHLNACLQSLSQSIIAREKLAYESYTNYYESMMRNYHNLLYDREQEIRKLTDDLQVLKESIYDEVEFQLADKAFHLLMEITAIRSRITRTEISNEQRNIEVRNEVKTEYSNLIEDLFRASIHLREKFDAFRIDLHEDVLNIISEVRREAIEAMEKISSKAVSTKGYSSMQNNLKQSEEIRELHSENNELNMMVSKLRTINVWHRNYNQANYMKTVNSLIKEVEKLKKENFEINQLTTEETKLLKQQLTALRKELAVLFKEYSAVKNKLDVELNEKEQNMYKLQQSNQFKQHIENLKQEQINKLEAELKRKNNELKLIEENYIHILKTTETTDHSSSQNLSTVKRTLKDERTLKRRAFQKVDFLQSAIQDNPSKTRSNIRTGYRSEPTTPIPLIFRSLSSRQSSNYLSPASVWAKKHEFSLDNYELRKLKQRPKTVSGRHLNNIQSQTPTDTHENIYELTDIVDNDT